MVKVNAKRVVALGPGASNSTEWYNRVLVLTGREGPHTLI